MTDRTRKTTGPGIYAITNILNGKRYVGSAIRISNRWLDHKRDLDNNKHHSQKLQRAWNKYGEANFEFSILELCTKSELVPKEQYWLDISESVEKGYNICPIARSTLGRKCTDEAKIKIGNANRGRKHTAETLAKMSKANKGKTLTDEHRAKISRSNKGRVMSEETLQKLIAANTGRKLSEEHKAKISASGRGRKKTEEHKAKIGAAHKGRKYSDDVKAKNSAAQKGNKNCLGRKLSDETKAKIGAATTARHMNKLAVYAAEQGNRKGLVSIK